MATGQWLRLTDYSSKYRVSISTLRRRIKDGRLQHRFADGRYLIMDEAPTEPFNEPGDGEAAQISSTMAADGPILSSANKLLSELKLAYMSILHEKEEQIIELKAEVSDLATLVRVLEDDNRSLRHQLGRPAADC